MLHRTLLPSIGFVVVACGNPPATPDALERCSWPIETTQPRGAIELGDGNHDASWVPLGSEVLLVFGAQGGFHIPIRGRIRGLNPGDPYDIFEPTNPRTRFRSFFSDGTPNTTLLCPTRVGYKSDGTDAFVTFPLEIRFDTNLQGEDLFDQPYRVLAEIIDADGSYATAEQVVTARRPLGW